MSKGQYFQYQPSNELQSNTNPNSSCSWSWSWAWQFRKKLCAGPIYTKISIGSPDNKKKVIPLFWIIFIEPPDSEGVLFHKICEFSIRVTALTILCCNYYTVSDRCLCLPLWWTRPALVTFYTHFGHILQLFWPPFYTTFSHICVILPTFW